MLEYAQRSAAQAPPVQPRCMSILSLISLKSAITWPPLKSPRLGFLLKASLTMDMSLTAYGTSLCSMQIGTCCQTHPQAVC